MVRSRLRQHATALAIPAMAAAFSAVQVTSQFRDDFGIASGRKLGKAERTEGEVLKRSARSFRWYSVAPSEDLVEKTSIKTAENSGVSLKFRDGSTLNLGPQALVVLGSAADGIPKLKVVRGEVSFKAKSKMVIEAGGKTLESGEGAGRVEVTHGAAKTSLTEGTGALVTADAAPLALAAGSIAMVDVAGVLTAKGVAKTVATPITVPPVVVTPVAAPPVAVLPNIASPTRSGDFEVFPYKVKGAEKLSTRLTASQNTKVLKIELSWMPVEGAKEYTIEFFNSKGVSRFKKVTTEPSLVLEIKKTVDFERSYRIVAKRDDREFRSTMLKYSIALASPVPAHPKQGKKFGGGIMTWESTILTDSYEVQLARDPAFKQFETITSDVNFANVRVREKGAYYWRIRAHVGGRVSPWSEARQFVGK